MGTILIVDDEIPIAELLGAVLEDEGYQVTLAGNGQEALECLAEVKPDLILSDVMMPILDGWGLLRALRTHPRTQTIPVILLSAASRATIPQEFQNVVFIPKPFDLDYVLGVVNQMLAGGAR